MTLTQCYLHKDLCSLELQQSGFWAAHSIKTALLEVTEGLCCAELRAASSSSPEFFPHCRLFTNRVCSHFPQHGYLWVLMLKVCLLLRKLLLAANMEMCLSIAQDLSTGVPLGSALCLLFCCFSSKNMSYLSSPLMLYALLQF